ncbi:GlxA family transcriptional regulator [Shimia marina]|uniref:Carnitine catabolism transcriptional activator n=1 Tax=Shimia marina TaxID=321267 RepID=A0A0P1ETV5_9RHOB|nr:GlxA family transcriptional regulator [Shimia marina]CUH53718.1 Carnitine catabolism transcriptional activator [Shimia marina]SFD70184.1 Transcriptional regulator GlxA family, contains an amidase domain and an AraC-type DNA-binding HTH domain [Shimia marina]
MTCHDTRPFLQAPHASQGPAHRFVFLLLPTHSPADVSLAIETLSEANAAGANPPYTWQILSEDGLPLRSQSGLSLAVEGGVEEIDLTATIFLCGGNRMEAPASQKLLNLLRKATRYGATLGALGSGCAILAQAGLLPDKKVAAHWAISTSIQETFPDLDVRQQVYDTSSKSLTCAGGLATADMFLNVIGTQQGTNCAQKTAAALACSSIRDQSNAQTLSAACEIGAKSVHLVQAVEIMRENLEHPLSPTVIAKTVGVSSRQLERLFSKHLGMSPKSYSNKLRLENARRLIQQTKLSVLEVAIASGFSSTSHFSKQYRKRFGASPSSERGIPSAS